MKLNLHDIPEEGLDFTWEAKKEPWLHKLFHEVYPEDYVGPNGQVGLNILKTYENVSIVGDANLDLDATCDRCLEKFTKPVHTPIQLTLLPYKSVDIESSRSNEAPIDDDDTISYYKSEEIDLQEIVSEALYLNISIRDLCKEDCKGLCPNCGQNLNLKTCDCKTDKIDPRLAVLKNFKAAK